MPRQYDAASVRQLSAVVDGMVGEVSSQRMQQLRMVLGMWDRAVGRPEMGDRSLRRCQQFFTLPVLRVFWDLAVAGELRAREEDRGTELPLATQRIVRDCLHILGRRVLPAGRRLWLPSVGEPDLRETVAPRGLDALYRGLVDLAAAGPLESAGTALSFEDRTRTLAMVAVVLDSRARSGELARMRVDDLVEGEAAVGVRRRQQKGPPNRAEQIAALAEVRPSAVEQVLWGRLDQVSEATRQRVLAAVAELGELPEVEWYALREGSRVAVRRWLEVRERLVNLLPLEGARTALWVTLKTTGAGGVVGLPLSPIGLRKAYVRGVTALNFVMGGQHGWEPMPTRMEQLRRSVDVAPLPGRPG
ncbi:hypothetical protein HY68_36815 [Streptomyces sp. AcH 505]|uniref:LacI family DNA-binding transcriptional regulator n=1 Tax=Streptomyces sp. AcH 505 TaxID=352211 RepID=UPI000591E7CD|nr:hypothetical protein HY68_36815 [Streptomyces sp. AcH 505]